MNVHKQPNGIQRHPFVWAAVAFRILISGEGLLPTNDPVLRLTIKSLGRGSKPVAMTREDAQAPDVADTGSNEESLLCGDEEAQWVSKDDECMSALVDMRVLVTTNNKRPCFDISGK